MKVKIRGLVFAGFAAAVFAQSAVAEIVPPSQGNLIDTQVDDLKKTVTSKYYVNENFQERETSGLGYNESTLEYTKKAVHVPWKYGEGGINKEWVELEGRKQLATGSSGLDTEYVEIVHDGKGADGHYIQMNASAVTTEESNVTGADKIAAAGESDATSLEKGRLTTAKAVYDFVNSELDEMGANIKGNTTYHTQKVAVIDETWGAQNGLTAPYHVVNPTGEQLNHIDHWELIVPDSTVTIDEQGSTGADKIAAAGVTGASDAVKNKLTTAKAVYDYLSDTYQPKATTATGAQVGVKNGDTSEWYTLAAGQDGRTVGATSQDAAYARIYRDDGAGTNTAGVYVDLDHNRIMLASTYGGQDTQYKKGISTVTSLSEGNGLALATAGAVKEYVDSITHGNTLPIMPDECVEPGIHCALVSSYNAGSGGASTDPNYVAPYATLEWTVMAPGA